MGVKARARRDPDLVALDEPGLPRPECVERHEVQRSVRNDDEAARGVEPPTHRREEHLVQGGQLGLYVLEHSGRPRGGHAAGPHGSPDLKPESLESLRDVVDGADVATDDVGVG